MILSSQFISVFYISSDFLYKQGVKYFSSNFLICLIKQSVSPIVLCITSLCIYSNQFYEHVTLESTVAGYTANMYSEITVRTQLKTVKLNYSFFTVIWTSILPYIVQCRSVDSSLQLLHCTWSSNQM